MSVPKKLLVVYMHIYDHQVSVYKMDFIIRQYSGPSSLWCLFFPVLVLLY